MSPSEWVMSVSILALVGIAGWALVTLIGIKTDISSVKGTITRLERDVASDRAVHASAMERVDKRFEWGAGSINKLKLALTLLLQRVKAVEAQVKILETKKGK